MGGDHGPSEIVPGVLAYARSHPADQLILVGDEGVVQALAGVLPANVSIVHASQVVGMDEHPALALREKRDASILVATDLVRDGLADAVVTAGHTGAGVAAGILRLGRLPGVDRPALAVQMITESGPMVLLDIGANPDSTPENLAQYARMGAIFAERVLGVPDPRVALLSIGEEKGKGDARIQRATELLDASALRFVGNVEGKDLTRHLADVVVCDAVLGNVVIKFFEGLSTFIFDLWRTEFNRVPRGKLAAILLKPGIDRIRNVFDYERAGGSPLLGVKGTVIITHGRAKRRMIGFACEVAATTARTRCRSSSKSRWPPIGPSQYLRGERSRRPRRRRERPRIDRRPVRHRRARPARGLRGPRGRAGRARRSGLAAARRRALGLRSTCDDQRHGRLWIVARPGQDNPLGPLPGGNLLSRATVERLLGLELGRSPSWSMASGADRVRGRRTGRRLALAAVFEADFGQRTADAVLERHLAEEERDENAVAARELRSVRSWPISRFDRRRDHPASPQYPVTGLARMDRALLRTAISEVLHSATPARVAIAEWVELARTYSGEPMRRLMNGVLGNIAAEPSGARPTAPSPNSEEGVSGNHVRAPQEDRRRAARRRRG